MKQISSSEALTPSVLLSLNFTPQCCYKEGWLCHTIETTVTTLQSDTISLLLDMGSDGGQVGPGAILTFFKRKQSDVLFKLWLHIFDILNYFFLLSPMQGTQKSSQKNL